MTALPFTHKPGRRERHLRRRHLNPLFSWPAKAVDPEALLAAQRQDHDEMEAFRLSLRSLIQRAVDLPPSAGSDLILALKEDLERHYEQSLGLPEDHTQEREAIGRLVALVMKAVKLAAGNDPLAQQKLADEEEARRVHLRLLQQPLVVDLLSPDSPIAPAELTPTLLSSTIPEIKAALELFDTEQVREIAEDAVRLADQRAEQGADMTTALERLAVILSRLELRYPDPH